MEGSMLTKQALSENLHKRYILLCRLYLNGYITNPHYVTQLLRFLSRVDSTNYANLLKWERRLTRIENHI